MKVIKNILIALVVIGAFIGAYRCGRGSAKIVVETRTDTVVVRDTIRDTVPVVKEYFITRTDTVTMRLAGDTVFVSVEVPIERQVYQTPQYKAEIEGFRPRLVSMELYQERYEITRTEYISVPDNRRWGIGVSAGYAVTPKGLQPYIGLGVQYNILKW